MLKWARERANLSLDMLKSSFPKIEAWEKGEKSPTLKQLEKFTQKVNIPIGYLFLPAPLEEKLPISDFRTLNTSNVKFSVDLLDTVYLCQQRQDWYQNYAISQSLPICDFVASKEIKNSPIEVAKYLRKLLSFSLEEQMKATNYEEMLRIFRNKVEETGILLMINGKVGTNTRRTLSLEEFRGFALSDKYAPLIFINAKDSKAGQIFTLAHELAHILLGQSGVSDTLAGRIPHQNIELWCNSVAAEFLVPIHEMEEILTTLSNHLTLNKKIDALSRTFKVSSFVILRRFYDAGFIDKNELWVKYQEKLSQIKDSKASSDGGGNFYTTFPVQASKRFMQAIITSTLEGQTLFKETFQLLGVNKTSIIYNAAKRIGCMHE